MVQLALFGSNFSSSHQLTACPFPYRQTNHLMAAGTWMSYPPLRSLRRPCISPPSLKSPMNALASAVQTPPIDEAFSFVHLMNHCQRRVLGRVVFRALDFLGMDAGSEQKTHEQDFFTAPLPHKIRRLYRRAESGHFSPAQASTTVCTGDRNPARG